MARRDLIKIGDKTTVALEVDGITRLATAVYVRNNDSRHRWRLELIPQFSGRSRVINLDENLIVERQEALLTDSFDPDGYTAHLTMDRGQFNDRR